MLAALPLPLPVSRRSRQARPPGVANDAQQCAPTRRVQQRGSSALLRNGASHRLEQQILEEITPAQLAISDVRLRLSTPSSPEGCASSQRTARASTLEQEGTARDRSPPLPVDFIGFTELDRENARYLVDTKTEFLLRYVSKEQKLLEAPSEKETLKRRRQAVNYREDEDLEDNTILCDECCREWEGDCPVHGPLEIIPDKQVTSGNGNSERDVKSLPECLSSSHSSISEAFMGVWTEKDLPTRQRFGPLKGTITTDHQTKIAGYIWTLKKDGRQRHNVSASDPRNSNWLRRVNCARSEEEQNLVAFQYKGQIYFRTCKPVSKGSEMLVDYKDGLPRKSNVNLETSNEVQSAPNTGLSFSGDVDTVRCPHCDYACLGQGRLDKHIHQNHGHIGRNGRYKCEWCEYSTDLLHGIRQHRRTHTGERPHRCDDCGKTFAQQGTLNHHHRVHLGKKSHRCDVCGKAFTQRGQLTRHMRVHSGEKVRQCEQCGATFSVFSNYTRHMQSHNGVKAYRCDVCPARLASQASLTKHMRIHTGERPYICSFCPKRFALLANMRDHVTARHTKNFRYTCDRCGKGFVRPNQLQRHADKCSADS